MKAATIRELKKELSQRPTHELLELCLQLSKFKKENKELLTYLLYEASDEENYINSVKNETEALFKEININSYFYIKKSVRKILRNTKKYIRYSKKKETEVELLIHFCYCLQHMSPPIKLNTTLENIVKRQIILIKKSLLTLHEDLQHDYAIEIKKIEI